MKKYRLGEPRLTLLLL